MNPKYKVDEKVRWLDYDRIYTVIAISFIDTEKGGSVVVYEITFGIETEWVMESSLDPVE